MIHSKSCINFKLKFICYKLWKIKKRYYRSKKTTLIFKVLAVLNHHAVTALGLRMQVLQALTHFYLPRDAACLCFTNQIRAKHLLQVYEQFFSVSCFQLRQLVWLAFSVCIPSARLLVARGNFFNAFQFSGIIALIQSVVLFSDGEAGASLEVHNRQSREVAKTTADRVCICLVYYMVIIVVTVLFCVSFSGSFSAWLDERKYQYSIRVCDMHFLHVDNVKTRYENETQYESGIKMKPY